MNESHENALREQMAQIAAEIRVWRDMMLRGEDGVDDTTLASYVTENLDVAETAKVAAKLEKSPELADIVDVVRDVLKEGSWRSEPVPDKIRLRPPLLSRLDLYFTRKALLHFETSES